MTEALETVDYSPEQAIANAETAGDRLELAVRISEEKQSIDEETRVDYGRAVDVTFYKANELTQAEVARRPSVPVARLVIPTALAGDGKYWFGKPNPEYKGPGVYQPGVVPEITRFVWVVTQHASEWTVDTIEQEVRSQMRRRQHEGIYAIGARVRDVARCLLPRLSRR